MINLLYIGNKLSSSGKTPTGIDTLSKFLDAEGFHVTTVSNKKNKLFRLLDMLYAILKKHKTTDYVLIDTYSTQNFYYAYCCSILCQFLKLKYIPILRGGNLPERLKSSPKLSRSIFKKAHINIAPSAYTKSNFEAFGYHNIVIIPNSIALEHYNFKQRPLAAVKMLWVRSFAELYNPKLAVSILKALQNKGISAALTMVGPDGDGSLEVIKALAKSENVEVAFTGKLSRMEWIGLSKQHNLFINTTNFDNMPVSVMEAMALGLPVVSTNVGGLPFLIDHDYDGILVPPNNAAAFVASIEALQQNPQKVKDITQKARIKVETYGWQTVKEKWKATLK